MKETIFKVNDRVFVANCGWGNIVYVKRTCCSIKFNPKDCIAYYEFFEPLTEEQIEILGLTNKNVE